MRFGFGRLKGSFKLAHAALTIRRRLPEQALRCSKALAQVKDDLTTRLGECERFLSGCVRVGAPREVKVSEERPNGGGCRGCGNGGCGGGR
jgi:hypothetical protein